MILYGAPVKEKIKEDLIEKITKLSKKPVLVVVQVGDREDSNIYIKQKQKFGTEIGVEVRLEKFEENKNEAELILEIEKLNKDKNVSGIILQLPLPEGFETQKILNFIDPKKDVDGLVSRLNLGSEVVPATARGVMALLDFYGIEIKDKKATVIGQSILAGKPIADELEKRGAKVTRCDIETENIPEVARNSHILVSAVGKPNFIKKNFVNEKQVVVDVGINRILDTTSPPTPLLAKERGEEKKLVGDVDFAEVEPLVFALTPVPGGIGPLTVACLFENLLDLCYNGIN